MFVFADFIIRHILGIDFMKYVLYALLVSAKYIFVQITPQAVKVGGKSDEYDFPRCPSA